MPNTNWSNPSTIQTVIASVVGIGTILGWLLGWWSRAWNWVKQRFTRSAPRVPRETIRVIVSNRGIYWNKGSRGETPLMCLMAHFYVTNITDDEVRILRTYLKSPPTVGAVFVQHPESNVFGSYPILPRTTSEVSLDFTVEPVIRQAGEDLKTTVVLVDQFGNEHKVKRVVFKGPEPERPATPQPASEAIYAIEDPVEKEVVSVLKAELARYAVCGRRGGGLGSVHLTYRGRALRGVGTDSWTPDSPLNQSIVNDPEAARLCSDNLDALIGLYESLKTDQERLAFANSLLSRLGKATPYVGVSYFITAVLMRVGMLSDALRKARADLPGGKEYGLSNVLMLLNGLLKHCHPEFTTDMLEEIERFVDGSTEHVFKIPERIAAIRAARLPKRNMIGV